MTDERKPNLRPLLFGLFGVVCAVVVGRPVIESLREPTRPIATPALNLPPDPEKVPPKPEEVAKPHLSRADQECVRAIGECIDPINRFFAPEIRLKTTLAL